jgi:hypothetical protein
MGQIALETVWILVSGHSQRCSKLRTCWHGHLIEATAATTGCIRLPRFSSAPHGARCFRRSEGRCHQPCTTLKKTFCGCCPRAHTLWYDRRLRQPRDLAGGDTASDVPSGFRLPSAGRYAADFHSCRLAIQSSMNRELKFTRRDLAALRNKSRLIAAPQLTSRSMIDKYVRELMNRNT